MPALKNTFDKHPNKFFVETGTGWDADGLLKARNTNLYEELRSCEGSLKYYNNCLNVCKNYNNIKLYLGLSENILANMIEDINVPITFWLDAHFAGGDQCCGQQYSPILKELEIIKNHRIKNHTILIDDIRCCNTILFNFLSLEDIINKILEINPKYQISFDSCEYPNDILVAKIVDD